MAWNHDTIVDLLLEAGRIAQRVKRDMRFELKPDRSIVTPADKEIEALFIRALEAPPKGTYLIGEETIDERGEEYLQEALRAEAYVIDPIDGTAPFAHLLPNWGISVGRMEKGVLTDGAVYLPDMGELVISRGEKVIQGTRRGDAWEWLELGKPHKKMDAYGLIAITQEIAKTGKVLLPNPVMVLGAAVVPMLGLVQDRFIAYLGSVKLWDIAGALPLILRQGFSVTVVEGGERREVTARVEERTYRLAPATRKRWTLRSDLLICHPGDEARLRAAFRSGDGQDREGEA